MPLIFSKDQIKAWIYEDKSVDKYLKMSSPMLISYQEYEQMSFFDEVWYEEDFD